MIADHMTYFSTQTKQVLTFEDLKESAIVNYFRSINQEKFEETAALFAEDGELLAPFKQPIRGRKAIASYLSQEAIAMELLPKQVASKFTEDSTKKVEVRGKVRTSLFTVNVGWNFSLNVNQQIVTAKIKLLASPQELLGLQQKRGY